jgi:hypothetical protein
LKIICAIVGLFGIIGLLVLALASYSQANLSFAQSMTQDTTKETKDLKRPSPGFEDDQSAMCLSATRQAKLLASIVESSSRRLGACSTSNPNFRQDCSAEFRGVVQSFNQYQIAISSVRNYCN